MIIPMVTISGQSLHRLDDVALLQLILRTDLPDFLMDVYTDEVDRRQMPQTTMPQEEAR